MTNLYILGNGGFAREVREQINYKYIGLNFGGYIYKDKDTIRVKTSFGNIKEFTFPKFSSFVLGTGDKKWRKFFIELISNKYKVDKFTFPNILADKCYASCYTTLGIGNLLCTDAIILGNAILGDFNLVNAQALISHDCIVGNNNLINPKVTMLGNSSIGNNNYLATNVTILPKVNIGNNNTISIAENINYDVLDNKFIKGGIESNKNDYII